MKRKHPAGTTVTVSFRVTRDVKAALARSAANDGTVIAPLMEKIVKSWLAQQRKRRARSPAAAEPAIASELPL